MPPINKNQTPAFKSEDDENMSAADKQATQSKPVSTGRDSAPTESVKQDRPVKVEEEEVIPQSYVWLANGNVLLVDDENLPGTAGPDNLFGFWHENVDGGTKVHQIVNVYPVEITVGE